MTMLLMVLATGCCGRTKRAMHACPTISSIFFCRFVNGGQYIQLLSSLRGDFEVELDVVVCCLVDLPAGEE
jgi:hypothetical protein